MPLINVKFIEGYFTEEQKSRMIEKLTDAFVACTFEATRPFIYVVIEEVKPGQWGVAGARLPDPEFLTNRFPKLVDDAASATSEMFKIPKKVRLVETPTGGGG